MNLGDIVQRYGTQLKEKISDVYDNHKRKILIGTLGSSLLLNSGCLTTALVGGAVGGLPGAIVGSLAGDALTYKKDKSNEENNFVVRKVFGKTVIDFKIRAPPLDGSPMYLDVDKNGVLDKIYRDPNKINKKLFGRTHDLYVEYGKPDGTFEKSEFLAETFF